MGGQSRDENGRLKASHKLILFGGAEAEADVTAPEVSSLNPADDATDVAIAVNLVATFNEDIKFAATFDIELRLTADDSVVELFDETDIGGTISIVGSSLTINPTASLAYSTEHYVHIPSGAIQDAAGNDFTGVTGTTWSFTTAAAPAASFFLLEIGDDLLLETGDKLILEAA